jgi:cysteine desulfurase
MTKVYLDHAGTTPIRREVFEAMVPYLTENFGNASTLYSYGREAKKALENSRENVAAIIGANPEEIFFTSGGTESDNWAIRGIALANRKHGNHIVTSSIEHPANLYSCQDLEKQGYKITYIPVDEHGLVNVDSVINAVTDETILVSIMHANNEIGTIQPIAEIGNALKSLKKNNLYFHTDAVQSVGKINVDVNDLNVDLLSISSHKLYGPKGVGALYIRKGTQIKPYLTGGAQENKNRAGTENIPAIVGFGKAVELISQEIDIEYERLLHLRDKLIDGIMAEIPFVRLNGHRDLRLPHNVNICLEFVEGESLLFNLDMKGICASSGSACSSGSLAPSHVLLALGIPPEIAQGSLRMTLGRDNTEEEIDYVIKTLPKIVERLRAMSPLFAEKKACPKRV